MLTRYLAPEIETETLARASKETYGHTKETYGHTKETYERDAYKIPGS